MLFNPKKAGFDHWTRDQGNHAKTSISLRPRARNNSSRDDHERVWYDDFLGFLKEEGILSACSPTSTVRDAGGTPFAIWIS